MSGSRRIPDLGIEPLTARSLALTALLGTHPPELPVRSLVALGALFGIAEGTMRTALSRMIASGELAGSKYHYMLGARMLHRQMAQDAGRVPPREPWDESWWFVIVEADRRTMGERRAFRTAMRDHRFGELRPEVWLRPANIAQPPSTDGLLVVRGSLEGRDPVDVAPRLWDLDAIASTGATLTGLVEDACSWLEGGDPAPLVDTFLVSVAAVRFLLTEPQLPQAIVGANWPPTALRTAYDRLEVTHGAVLSSFLTVAARRA